MFAKKKYSISAAAIGLTLVGSSVNCFADAICFENIKPHVGFNVLQMQTKFKSGYGDNLFKKNLPAGEIYAGVAINDYFGVNVGYYSSSKKNRDATLVTGDVNLGYILPAGASPAVTENNVKLSGAFIDLEGNLPINSYNLSLFASIGIEHAKMKLQRNILSTHGNPYPVNLKTTELSGKKTLFRLNTGINKNINTNIALRALIGWKNLSQLKASGVTPSGLNVRSQPKNNINYGIGIQYTFN